VRKIVRFVLPSKIIENAFGNVAHIRRALAQVFVVDSAEGAGIFFSDLLEGVFGSDLLLKNDAADFLDERGIFQHEQMCIEDAGIL
jgi:hypothetical protein